MWQCLFFQDTKKLIFHMIISFAKLESKVTWPFADIKSMDILYAIGKIVQLENEFTTYILSFEIVIFCFLLISSRKQKLTVCTIWNKMPI